MTCFLARLPLSWSLRLLPPLAESPISRAISLAYATHGPVPAGQAQGLFPVFSSVDCSSVGASHGAALSRASRLCESERCRSPPILHERTPRLSQMGDWRLYCSRTASHGGQQLRYRLEDVSANCDSLWKWRPVSYEESPPLSSELHAHRGMTHTHPVGETSAEVNAGQ